MRAGSVEVATVCFAVWGREGGVIRTGAVLVEKRNNVVTIF